MKIKKTNENIAKFIESEEFMIHDADGKLVPFKISKLKVNE
jgi:hypothetical protein